MNEVSTKTKRKLTSAQMMQLQGLLLQKRCSMAEEIILVWSADDIREISDEDVKEAIQNAFKICDAFVDEVERRIERQGLESEFFGPLYDSYSRDKEEE